MNKIYKKKSINQSTNEDVRKTSRGLSSIIQRKETILLYTNNQLAVTSFNINIAVLCIRSIKQIMSMKLKDFMCFLHENKLVDLHSLLKKDELGCINRLKLQKYVYLAQTCLNNDFGYEYSVYSNGPYSPELAN
ncbi:MAG: hypothetical protein M3Y25_01135, partial [Thermoproteota archaeon]|nr:hypothetical protein [Thermoproteota archaeon]